MSQRFNTNEMRFLLKYAPVLILVIVVGLIIGAVFFQPPVGKGVGHMDRVVEKPVLFDRPLSKGVENLNWNK